jgi:hypothetical protein
VPALGEAALRVLLDTISLRHWPNGHAVMDIVGMVIWK